MFSSWNIDVPFSSLEPTAPPRERKEYITLDRLIKYGGTPGCGACSKAGGVHAAFCKARFNGLVRADRIASGSRTPRTPGREPITPSAPHTPAVEDTTVAAPEAEGEIHDEYAGVPLDDLPFSAGVPPGMIGKVNA